MEWRDLLVRFKTELQEHTSSLSRRYTKEATSPFEQPKISSVSNSQAMLKTWTCAPKDARWTGHPQCTSKRTKHPRESAEAKSPPSGENERQLIESESRELDTSFDRYRALAVILQGESGVLQGREREGEGAEMR